MAYTRDQDQYCGKCKKKTKHVRCPRCNGKGGSLTTQCRHCGNSGYKCENGVNDQYHD